MLDNHFDHHPVTIKHEHDIDVDENLLASSDLSLSSSSVIIFSPVFTAFHFPCSSVAFNLSLLHYQILLLRHMLFTLKLGHVPRTESSKPMKSYC